MTPAITDVAGITVGHAHDDVALTGVTVVLCPEGAVASVDVRGGGPATRETDLLAPEAMVQQVHAVALCGGSAMGLDAAAGVVQWLREHNYGFDTRITRVPIVPGAALFDLGIGQADRFPDPVMGYAACQAAGTAVAEGNLGAGIGATIGKILGPASAMKAGVGTWSERLPDGTTVGALVVVNAFGDVRDLDGTRLAGARNPLTGEPGDTMALLRDPRMLPAFGGVSPEALTNTTLAVVATDATLDKAAARKLAQMAQVGLARTINPIHTPFDGDAVFALATGRRPAPPMIIMGSIAAEVLARAVTRAVLAATSLGGLPGAGSA
ncbi:MAG: P1 family peptidase [Oscillochloridaceae bacterium umkhey_bin13]